MIDSKYAHIDEFFFKNVRENVAVITAKGRNLDELDFDEYIDILVQKRDRAIQRHDLNEKIAANEAKLAANEAKIAEINRAQLEARKS